MRKAGMKAASIEDCLRDHVSICRDLVEGREPRVGILTMRKHWRALKERYGEDGERRILERAQALTREIFGGAEPPPLANLKVDALSYVDADIAAENIAKEFRAAGVRPSKDPEWKAKLNERFAALLKRHYAEIEQRAAVVQRQEATIEIPTAQIEALVDASVKRVLTTRSNGAVPVTYWGVWKADKEYSFGNVVTDSGCLWHCEGNNITDRPGKSPGWKLMHKSMERTGTR